MAAILEFRDSVGANNGSAVSTSSTALPANMARTGWQIQNVGTNPLFVYFGTGGSSSQYSFVLKASTGAADGTGGSYAMMDGNVYRGIVTVGGTSPSYVILEL